jgi:hypothetical protein
MLLKGQGAFNTNPCSDSAALYLTCENNEFIFDTFAYVSEASNLTPLEYDEFTPNISRLHNL